MSTHTTTLPHEYLPTKAELQKAFSVTNDCFTITTGPPPPLTTQPPEAYLEKREYLGRRVNLTWARPGWLLIAALVPLGASELAGYPAGTTFVLSDSDHESVPSIERQTQGPTYIATTPAPVSPSQILPLQEWDSLPTGSTLRRIRIDVKVPSNE